MTSTNGSEAMATTEVVRRRSESRLLRGYGPLIGWIVAFLAMVLLAPTVAPEQVVTNRTTNVGGGAVDESGAPIVSGTEGRAAVGAGRVELPRARRSSVIRTRRPCRGWGGGNNGGATARGVTKDTITIAWRDVGGPYDIGATIGSLTGKRVNTGNATRDDLIRTYETLIEYMNRRFQFYGRKMKLAIYKAGGSASDELLGGGQSGANADAIKEAQEVGAFADVGAQAPVFADALAHQKVIATNPIYPSNASYKANYPYNFGLTPDCDKVARFVSDFMLKQIMNNPVIAGEFKGQKRKVGILYPDSPAYSPCADHAREIFKAANVPFPEARTYRLSLDGIPPDSRDIAAAYANQGITTVVLFTDPLVPYFMTATAEQSDWHPEWIEAGVAFLDTDFAGQLYEPLQWKNAFGVSLLGELRPPGRPPRTARTDRSIPTTSPVDLAVEGMYYNLYMLAIGIQMAGPNLTPETFGQGLRAYKPAAPYGPAGSWLWPEGEYTAPMDGKIVWWDPNKVSTYNGQRGAYADDGRRFMIGQIPAEAPKVSLTP